MTHYLNYQQHTKCMYTWSGKYFPGIIVVANYSGVFVISEYFYVKIEKHKNSAAIH